LLQTLVQCTCRLASHAPPPWIMLGSRSNIFVAHFKDSKNAFQTSHPVGRFEVKWFFLAWRNPFVQKLSWVVTTALV
jgi:hypothetical protein